MKILFAILLTCVYALTFSQFVPSDEAPLFSPRLKELKKSIESGDKEAVAKFWEAVKGRVPLVELIPDDKLNVWVTYLWRSADHNQAISVTGGVPTFASKVMVRLLDTDIWFRTERTPRDGRFGYLLWINPTRNKSNTFGFDPLNPQRYADESAVVLPDAKPQFWSDRIPGTPKGKLAEFTIASRVLDQQRHLTVYLPSGYRPDKRYPLLLALDGESYGGDPKEDPATAVVPTPIILDNLIAQKRIAPMVCVMLDSGPTRDRDMSFHKPFMDFVAGELIPWLRKRYSLTNDPRKVVVSGSSRAGLGAACLGFAHPEIFGNVLALSGAFWWEPKTGPKRPSFVFEQGGWLTRKFISSPRLPVRFWLSAGKFEAEPQGSILTETRRLRDVLLAKGYRTTYREYTGGHDYIVWRGALADGLIWLMGIAKR